jgi:hypothetical protein
MIHSCVASSFAANNTRIKSLHICSWSLGTLWSVLLEHVWVSLGHYEAHCYGIVPGAHLVIQLFVVTKRG